MPRDKFAAMVNADHARWGAVIKAVGHEAGVGQHSDGQTPHDERSTGRRSHRLIFWPVATLVVREREPSPGSARIEQSNRYAAGLAGT
jgi:hypothetical protein